MKSSGSRQTLLPEWIRDYDRSRFTGDLFAGITVGVVLVPQGMAYALLAGVPPIYGLYASLIPLFVYSFFGTSRHLAVGIVAIDSLIVAAGIASMAPSTPADALALAFMLALMVGLIQMVMGALRFGFVVNLLSRPVITGFTGAAAIIIGLSQLKHLLGVPLGRNLNVFFLLSEAIEKVGATHIPTLLIGLAGIIILVLCRKQFPRIPGPLTAVVLSTLAVIFLNLDEGGVSVVGIIPSGLPSLAVPAFTMESVEALLPTALTLALVQFMGVISLSKVFAAKHGYQIYPSRELVVLGAMNVAGSFFQSVPVSGSYSRSAVNEQSGAQTSLANGIAALLVGLVLLFLTPVLKMLPIPIFAAIIMVSAFGLIDVREVRYLLTTKVVDGTIALITFIATLTLGIHQGVLVGVGISVIAVMYRISKPNVAILGHLPDSRSFRDVENHALAHEFDGVVILRIDASFSFANADRLRYVITSTVRKRDAKAVILDASTVNDMDSTALAVLSDTNNVLRENGVDMYIASARQPVLDVLNASGVSAEIGGDHFFLSPHRAVLHVLSSWGRESEYRSRI